MQILAETMKLTGHMVRHHELGKWALNMAQRDLQNIGNREFKIKQKFTYMATLGFFSFFLRKAVMESFILTYRRQNGMAFV